MNQVSRTLIGSLYRGATTLSNKLAPPEFTAPPAWRTVRQGALSGTKLYVPLGSWAELMLDSTFEPAVLDCLSGLVSSDAVFYDIGGHIGYFTCAWMQLGGSRVETFEPAASNYTILQNTIQQNNLSDKVRVHNFALGDFNGEAQLMLDASDLGKASTAFVSGLGGIEVFPYLYEHAIPSPIRVRKLDDVFREENLPKPDVLKIDVEGAEYHVLAGAVELLRDAKPIVLTELHDIEGAMQIVQTLTELGYTRERLGKGGGLLPMYKWTPV